jgi:hypothetical protein
MRSGYFFLFAVLIGAAVILGNVIANSEIVTAAPLAKQQPAPCVEIAVIGQIHTFQCETLQGQPYLQNSMGFMAALGN